jgi:hypothetical protein
MSKLFVNSIDGLTTETDFDIYFAPKNGMRANEINISRPGKRLKKELNIVQDMISVLVNRPIRDFDFDTLYQYGELVQIKDVAGDSEFVHYYQSQVDDNIGISPLSNENTSSAYWKQFEPFGNHSVDGHEIDYKNDVKFGYQMQNSGYFIVGDRLGKNVSIDRDEIAARTFDGATNSVHPSILRMQANGGMLTIHGNLWSVESERYRVSTFTDDGRFILGNKETIHTDTDPHEYGNCFKFECWGDALITQDARFGGWVTFDKGFARVPSMTIQDGIDASLTDRLLVAPNVGNGNIEINCLTPILDEGSTLYINNHPSQSGELVINSGSNTVHVTNEGMVGIKKTAPTYALDVAGTIASNFGADSSIRLINTNSEMIINACMDDTFHINSYKGDDRNDLYIQDAGGDTYFNCTAGAVHITSSGQIGVGKTNPSCALDVLGNGFVSGGFTSSSYTAANDYKVCRIEPTGYTSSSNFRLTTASIDGSTSRLYIQDNMYSDTIFNGDNATCINENKVVHITKDGNLGVGRKDPTYKLYVDGGQSMFSDKINVGVGSSAETAFETVGRVKATYFDGTLDASGADVAEKYESDEVYEPGTIVSIGGDKEITLGTDTKPVAGVISTEPAVKMNDNDDTDTENHLYVALVGRVPCKVNGDVKKGQYIVVDSNGKGKGVDMPQNTLLVVGVALSDSKDGIVEVKV